MPHECTSLNAMLCWLDARAHGAQFWLRYDDLDGARADPAYRYALERGLCALGLQADGTTTQSALAGQNDKVNASPRLSNQCATR